MIYEPSKHGAKVVCALAECSYIVRQKLQNAKTFENLDFLWIARSPYLRNSYFLVTKSLSRALLCISKNCCTFAPQFEIIN